MKIQPMPKKQSYAIPDPGNPSPGVESILKSLAVTVAITDKVRATKIFIFWDINSCSQWYFETDKDALARSCILYNNRL